MFYDFQPRVPSQCTAARPHNNTKLREQCAGLAPAPRERTRTLMPRGSTKPLRAEAPANNTAPPTAPFFDAKALMYGTFFYRTGANWWSASNT